MHDVSTLLKTLRRDWGDKRTVKECLRSKAVPCPEVRKAMMLTDQEVDDSYQQVIEYLLPTLNQTGETLEMLTRLATVFRFLQYLLEKNDNNQRIVQLLQAILANTPVAVCSNVNLAYNGDLAETANHQKQQLGLFAIGSLLRLNHYVTRKPFLLSPVWKGISDLAKALGLLPPELSQMATKYLLDLINDGFMSLPTAPDVTKQIFFIKVLTFLVGRLSVLLTIGCDLHGSLSERFLQTTYILRGLKMAVIQTGDKSLQQGVDQVATKTEKCVSTWLAKRQQDGCATVLKLLMETSTREVHKSLDLAFVQGRSVTILEVVERVIANDSQRSQQDIETILMLIEELVFDLLPREWSTASPAFQCLLSQSITTIVDVLIVCDQSLLLERTAFHFLLIRWLSLSDVHPFTRELLTSITQLFTIEQCCYEQSSSFLSLLVKLSTDGRTSMELRFGISNCLSRMLQSQFRDKVKSLLVVARNSILKSMHRKRKLSKHQTHQTFRLGDIATLTRLVATLPDDHAQLPAESNQFHQSAIRASVMTNGLHSLIELFLQRGHQIDNQGRSFADLGILILRRIRESIEKENRPTTADLVRLCRVIEMCENSVAEKVSPLELERIQVLGVIGQAITEDTPSTQLQKLAKTFYSLLADTNWIISAYTMTSFVQFASTVPAVHKRFLAECVPPKAQGLFKQRLSGQIQSTGLDDALMLRARCTTRLIPQHRRTNCILKKPNKFCLALGSFVISMPTQEGRNALVVFPPGDDSIKDIEYFRNGEEPFIIQELHGLASQPDGSCHMVLRERGRS
ncbi:hypothetical protein FisN_13Lh066 [Fistulifera solaris]|uniref:Uncharacterized protein n=1 Tax=Fistulifera solaris TaxID=1519565 RepID=A0A1Z5JF98_FISSO|nr:hypothetical protein FisN_13Lh066 [Fistulifera solaris]|eukprot:GAX12606.1 hypothetical protein FisN_13Lh066 [Fistulifera solaris]